jgi:hypothetical protein
MATTIVTGTPVSNLTEAKLDGTGQSFDSLAAERTALKLDEAKSEAA